MAVPRRVCTLRNPAPIHWSTTLGSFLKWRRNSASAARKSRPWSADRPRSPPGTSWRSRAKASAWRPFRCWTPGLKLAPEKESCIGYGTSTVTPPIESTMLVMPRNDVIRKKSMWIPVSASTVFTVSSGPPADIAELILLVPCPGMDTRESRGNPRMEAACFFGFTPMMWMESDRSRRMFCPGRASLPRARMKIGFLLAKEGRN